MNDLSLLNSQSITAHEALADLQAIAQDLDLKHHKALVSCADDETIDSLELQQKLTAREIVRATAAATDADRALVDAQTQLKAEARKVACDEFTVADNKLRKSLEDLAKAASAYVAAAGAIGPAHGFNQRDQALVRARALGARLAPDDLPKPTPDILQAHRASTLTVEWLNSRALTRY